MSLSWIKNFPVFRAGFLPFSFVKGFSFARTSSALLAWLNSLSIANSKNKSSLGIVVGQNTIWAVHSSASNEGRQVDWVEICHLDHKLFIGKPNATHGKELNVFFKSVYNRIGKKFIRIQVSLPDPVALIGFYPIQTVPRKTTQCRELACWRISKQFHAQDRNLACDYQLTGKSGDKQVLMAVAVDADWLMFLQNTLKENGLLVPVIDLGISHYFNQLDETEKKACGAFIDLSDEYWTVIAWDKKGSPRFIRSRWRKKEQDIPAGELADIATEIIQALLVYSHDGQDMEIDTVLISGQDKEREILAAHFQQHMTNPVKNIALPVKSVETNIPATAYAVVIPR